VALLVKLECGEGEKIPRCVPAPFSSIGHLPRYKKLCGCSITIYNAGTPPKIALNRLFSRVPEKFQKFPPSSNEDNFVEPPQGLK